MASATATARAEPGGREPDEEPQRRPLFRFGGSRLGGFILVLNLLSLLILFGGALAINEWRPGLIEARQESLTVQAELLAQRHQDALECLPCGRDVHIGQRQGVLSLRLERLHHAHQEGRLRRTEVDAVVRRRTGHRIERDLADEWDVRRLEDGKCSTGRGVVAVDDRGDTRLHKLIGATDGRLGRGHVDRATGDLDRMAVDTAERLVDVLDRGLLADLYSWLGDRTVRRIEESDLDRSAGRLGTALRRGGRSGAAFVGPAVVATGDDGKDTRRRDKCCRHPARSLAHFNAFPGGMWPRLTSPGQALRVTRDVRRMRMHSACPVRGVIWATRKVALALQRCQGEFGSNSVAEIGLLINLEPARNARL